MGAKTPDNFTHVAYPDCESNKGITRAVADPHPGLWVPPKWQSNRPTAEPSLKKMEEWLTSEKAAQG